MVWGFCTIISLLCALNYIVSMLVFRFPFLWVLAGIRGIALNEVMNSNSLHITQTDTRFND